MSNAVPQIRDPLVGRKAGVSHMFEHPRRMGPWNPTFRNARNVGHPAVAFFAGNHINGFLFGSGGEAALTGTHLMPAAGAEAMGNTLAVGRRAAITAMDLAKGGPAPGATNALGFGTNLAGKAVLHNIERFFNMGLSAEMRLGIDLGASISEGIGCVIPQ